MTQPSRYIVGIDLGTTNSAMAFVDSHEDGWRPRVFRAPQLVAPFQVEPRDTLPSFHYQATQAEAKQAALRLPWSDGDPTFAVGAFARDEGLGKPGRMIASAKSWLCHAGVDRTAELLPWYGDTDVERLSPVEVSSRYLRHLRCAWDAAFPKYPLAEQDVVLTLPASFDEVARELTVQAARRAELPRIHQIEEPQAAFYAWVNRHTDDWREHVAAGQKILVCDIGGGTSDFTLIRVRSRDGSDEVEFHRIAVGEHLILGGDNLDLALAQHMEGRLVGEEKLAPAQWDVLVRASRRVKETLLSADAPQQFTVNLPAAGARLVGAALQAEVHRTVVEDLLVNGFLPRVELGAQPLRRQSGFQEFGLPYAADSAITRYLAAFLTAHRHTAGEGVAVDHDPARPDLVLFNGGFFASPVLKARLLEVLANWFSTADQPWSPVVLENDELDRAVAHGAAYYGMVRRGEGIGIAATTARSYYLGVAHDRPVAVCVTPGDAAAGEDFELDQLEFQLTLSEPVEFPLFVSSTRLVDQPGEMVELDPAHLTPLPPIRTVLRATRKSEPQTARVRLHAHISEIGAIELSCRDIDSPRSWRLQFDIRSATQTDLAPHESAAESEGIVDDRQLAACRELIAGVFSTHGAAPPAKLIQSLAEVLESQKHEWPTSVLRRLWEMLMEHEPGRRKSKAHEARWLNLTGYALRPGYGFAVDDWRVAETWQAINGKAAFPTSQAELLVLWRRVSGGLHRGQQLALAEPLLAAVRAIHRRFTGGKSSTGAPLWDPAQSAEMWRLLGALELLPAQTKLELGDVIVELLPKRKLQKVRSAMTWALGRLGQRTPVYGPLNTVAPIGDATRWLEKLMQTSNGEPIDHLAAMQLVRLTGDRHRDVDQRVRRDAINWMRAGQTAEHLVELVEVGGALALEETTQVFGDVLPAGLRLR